MLIVECTDDWIISEVDFDVECSVAIVNHSVCHIVWRDVIVSSHPLGIPPSVGDTYLIPIGICLAYGIECSSLNYIPNIFWECSNTLVVAIVSVKSAMSDGNIWASTDNGLTFISKQDDELKCRPFFDSDGLHDMTFYNNAALTTSNGTVLLGCLTGYVSIPAEVMEATAIQRPIAPMQVRFTEFRINNNPIVMQAKDFTIDYGERLGLSISMMLPALSHKIRYYYRFKGEDEWLRAPTNMLYFASLMPGTHVLQVKAELTGMATSEVSELKFRVRPPLWLSEWAILCYLLLLSAAAWFTWKAARRRQKREVAMKQMEINLKKYEMEEDKIRFFTNISHDLKTPLTLVVAPLEKIREHNLPEAIRTEIDVAWRNARQLHNLVLELFDFRRLDVGKGNGLSTSTSKWRRA